MVRIQTKKHEVGTYEIVKISLSCFDDKRFVLDDGIHTLAYFHKEQLLTKKIKKCFRKKRDSHGQKRFKKILIIKRKDSKRFS